MFIKYDTNCSKHVRSILDISFSAISSRVLNILLSSNALNKPSKLTVSNEEISVKSRFISSTYPRILGIYNSSALKISLSLISVKNLVLAFVNDTPSIEIGEEPPLIALSTALIVIVLNEVASHKALINVSICVEVNEPLLILSNPPDNP